MIKIIPWIKEVWGVEQLKSNQWMMYHQIEILFFQLMISMILIRI